jgi:hypothetical protein
MSFSTVRLTREQIIEESINILVRQALAARGYVQDGSATGWQMMDSYPYGLTELNTNLVAAGFNFDDLGKPFELGSNMKERKYTFELFVFGVDLTFAKAIAEAVKFSIEVDQAVALYNITQTPPVQNGEWVELDGVHSGRQVIPTPEPWQEFVWVIRAQVTDWYDPLST